MLWKVESGTPVGQHQIDTVAKYRILHWDAIQVRMILPLRHAIGIMGYTLEASKKDPVVVVQEVFDLCGVQWSFCLCDYLKPHLARWRVCVCGKSHNESCVGMWVVL
jgi:hypothetical protein